jgi:hypothetical protein
MTKTVEIVDSMMGTNKTTSIIKWIDNQPIKRFIYVSPLLSEAGMGGRLHQSITKSTFHAPEDLGDGKAASLLELLKLGANISCTHSLYKLMTEEHFEYTVILDEEIGLIEAFNEYSTSDLRWLLNNNVISVDEKDGMVSWISTTTGAESPSHKYYRMRQMCNAGCLYTTKRSDTMLTIQLPSKLIECAHRMIVLTYLFDGGVLDSFLKLKGIKAIPFTEHLDLQKVSGSKIRELLIVDQPPKKFDLRDKLTYSWYLNPNKGDLDVVRNAIRNMALKWGVIKDNLMYTFPKHRSVASDGRAAKIKPNSFTLRSDGSPCWLAAQTRATNDYAHITHIIHAYNRHPNVAVAAYLQDYEHPVDKDRFALSELIQFLWRGCIRNGQPMHVCIFSSRMEKLLKNWLDSLPD